MVLLSQPPEQLGSQVHTIASGFLLACPQWTQLLTWIVLRCSQLLWPLSPAPSPGSDLRMSGGVFPSYPECCFLSVIMASSFPARCGWLLPWHIQRSSGSPCQAVPGVAVVHWGPCVLSHSRFLGFLSTGVFCCHQCADCTHLPVFSGGTPWSVRWSILQASPCALPFWGPLPSAPPRPPSLQQLQGLSSEPRSFSCGIPLGPRPAPTEMVAA